MSQLIDMEVCKEFMKETLAKIEKNELIEIADHLKEKSDLFINYLGPDSISNLTEPKLTEVLTRMFSAKRKIKVLFEKYTFKQYKSELQDLLYGSSEIDVRFQNFIDAFKELDIFLRFDVAGEILHYTQPDKYWLWNRWLWDPKANTGSLPLVTNEEFKLSAATYGEMYMNVGKAVAFVHSMAESAEFQFINRSLFGTDVYLSCVYVIYAYNILKIKMTDEFNKVMPGLPEFSRRILGIYSSKEMTVV